MSDSLCRCGSGKPFEACCAPFLKGEPAPTAEALMRSRYSAFATGNVEHLVRTSAKPTSDAEKQDLAKWCRATLWLGLEVRRAERGQPGDLEGIVEFTARFVEEKELWAIEERSRFEKHEGRWLYSHGDGRRFRLPKPGRNEVCVCGSGKKFKQCHGA